MSKKAEILVTTKDMSREEWLEQRKRGIGGSDAAAIAGLNKWKSPMQVYLEKIGAVDSEPAGEEAYWGNVLEDIVAKEFSVRTGFKVRRKNAMLVHPDYPFMVANIDREILDPERGRGVLEVKTTNAFNAREWEGESVPENYLMQMMHYLAVTGLSYGYFAVLIGGQRFKHILVERDEELIAYLIQIESDFWKLVESKTPPEMDGSEASSRILDYLYPADETEKEEVELPDEVLAYIEQHDLASSEEKAAKERKEEAANKIKALLGNAEIGRVGDYKVSWKSISSTRFDSKALQKEHPEMFEKFAKSSNYRRFTIS